MHETVEDIDRYSDSRRKYIQVSNEPHQLLSRGGGDQVPRIIERVEKNHCLLDPASA